MDDSWKAIFDHLSAEDHDFSKEPLFVTADDIKQATRRFKKTSETEVRILCKQDSRANRPSVFRAKEYGQHGLFLLPVQNGNFVILQGNGYLDITPIESTACDYVSKLGFPLKSAKVGNSEMQHLDFAYAVSMVRTFFDDQSLVLTIRGRKYTPEFSFRAGDFGHHVTAKSVQTEVDAGYEGRTQIVLLEAKNSKTDNVITRQLFYPYRQWSTATGKKVRTAFFEKRQEGYSFWEYSFSDDDYNSPKLVQSALYSVKE